MKRNVYASLITAGAAMALCAMPAMAESTDSYSCQLVGTVTDAGEVVSDLVIDYGDAQSVENVDENTFTVHANANIDAFLEGTDVTSTGDYDIDRTITGVDVDGAKVTIHFAENEGATLCYTTGARNYPADLTYTITQNNPITLTDADGNVSDAYTADYTCDNSVVDDETAKFESVIIDDGINYQFYDAGDEADTLVVWFHGNGEGDLLESKNNVAQMLANRGTVAWATDEFQDILGNAYVMSFQAPDTWYYAQKDGLLEKAYNEIEDVISEYGIDPNKVLVSGCSAGGYMTTRMIIAYPDLFTAAMINCPALNVADARGGETPTDDELASIKDSRTAIWLVQCVSDGVVSTDYCARRLYSALTADYDAADLSETLIEQDNDYDSTMDTYETADGKYKMTIYDTTADNKLMVAEDYDRDGQDSQVQYNSHWSWIYTLKNDPEAADGTHIVAWAAQKIAQ